MQSDRCSGERRRNARFIRRRRPPTRGGSCSAALAATTTTAATTLPSVFTFVWLWIAVAEPLLLSITIDAYSIVCIFNDHHHYNYRPYKSMQQRMDGLGMILVRKNLPVLASKGSIEDEVVVADPPLPIPDTTTTKIKAPYLSYSDNDTTDIARSVISRSGLDIERQISLAGRQGRTDEAVRMFDQIQQPTIRQINAIIDACARARPVRLSTALSIVQSYTTIVIPDAVVANVTASASNIPPNSINSTSVQQKRNYKMEANVYTYGSLMNAISRLGRVELALYVLTYMKQHGRVAPNAVVYQSAITAAANAARSDIALQILEDARNENVSLTVIGYNAAITAASRVMNYTLAVQILRTMQSDPTLPDPDSVTYGTVMAACENCNEWKMVLQFAQEIDNTTNPDLYLDGMAITSSLKACQQLGYASTAIEYLNRMKLLMNNSHTSDTRSIQQQYSTKTTSGRERIGSKQPLQGPDAVAYRLAISACARGGAWQDGIRLLNEYCETVNPHDVVAYTAAITGCEYAGQWMQAVQLLVRMRTAGVQPNIATFTAVIGACATACAKMNDSNSNSESYNDKKGSHATNDEISMPLPQKKALQILNVMKKDATVIDPNIQVYNAAIRACAEALDMKRAFQLFQMLQDEGHQPNIITYGTLMLACERVGSIEGMNQVFAIIRNDNNTNSTAMQPNEIVYGTAISCCRKAGDSERSFLLLEKMIRDGYTPNVATINTVLIAQTEGSNSISNKELERATNVFKKFLLGTNATTLGVSSPNRQSYGIMIRAFASNQRPKDAEALLQRMRTVGKIVPDVDLYTITVSSYERIGQPLNALRLMESMREDGYDFYDVEVLNTLFKRLVKLVNALGQTLGKSKSGINMTTTLL